MGRFIFRKGSHSFRVVSGCEHVVAREAYRCVFHNGDTDYFHTLRLMEARGRGPLPGISLARPEASPKASAHIAWRCLLCS